MVQTNGSAAAPRPPLLFGENLRITVAANQGGRRYMEDRCVIHTERDEKGQLIWTFVGVFDGHGGEHASEYVRRHLLMNITKNQKFDSDSDEDILESIRCGFLMTHEQMRHVHDEWPNTASGYPSTAGTTVSCVFIRNGKLYTGHVGDSAIFLGTVENGELHVCPLTVDHKPESAAEQLRIARAGGETAVKSGVTRVVWKRRRNSMSDDIPIIETIPFLSVARSLGDLWSFNENTNTFVVSPEPDLGVHRISANDFCILLASDGMTNVLTGEQAVSLVFREEELVEVNDEMNRNHSRCVLRTALQKWRTLRADNVTVATVVFDLEPFNYEQREFIGKVGKYSHTSQALTDRPDAMLRVSKTENVLLATQRAPIMYNGSKDPIFCRVNYRGPGFRTHEEEMLEERRNLMNRFTENTIAIAVGGTIDAKRVVSPKKDEASKKKEEEENVEYDEDEDEDDDDEDDYSDEDDEEEAPAQEIDLKIAPKITMFSSPTRPPRPHAPRPVFIDDSIVDPSTSENMEISMIGVQKVVTPTKGGVSVRRVKAEAVRRLRTPKIGDSENSGGGEDRRVTRSAARAAVTPERRVSLIGVNPNFTPDAVLRTPPRRSNRLNPETSSAKLTLSRKRGRSALDEESTGITPVVSSISLTNSRPVPPTPSRSDPGTPQKRERGALRWSSLSKLDDGQNVERVSEVADEEEEDVMREPPSKIRRFYGYMRRMLWGK